MLTVREMIYLPLKDVILDMPDVILAGFFFLIFFLCKMLHHGRGRTLQ